MRFVNLPALVLATAVAGWPQERCGVAQDLVVQALENLKTSAAPADVADGIQLLKQAVLGCPTLGDAWYYRSLFETKLGHQQLASFALRQAKLTTSPAMDSGLNPFQLAAPPELKQPVGPVHQKWALVVGVGRFKDKANNLPYTKKDADDFAAVLKNPQIGRFTEDHVKVLTNADATLSNVKAGLNWIAREASPSDLVLVYVASHGTARQKDSVGHLNYILTNDTDDSDEDKLYGSALPMVDISEVVRSRIQALRTIIFLDTCHSEGGGSLLRSAAPSETMMDRMKAGTGRVIIAAAREKQRSFESDKFQNGIFTHFLIEGLMEQGGNMPVAKIFSLLETEVPKVARMEAKEDQTPVMFRSEQGAEIIIGAPPSTAAQNRSRALQQLSLVRAISAP
jgi:uncharacterized caspase-like protein